MKPFLFPLAVFSLVIAGSAIAQSTECPMHAQHMASAKKATSTEKPAACPLHAQHMADQEAAARPQDPDGSAEHGTGVDHRHDTLGVAHETTRHSFRLFDDGAAIELRASDGQDTTTIEAIRAHMRVIADQFRANDFSTPMFVHDKTPDGIATMKQLHSEIEFRYEPLPAGARVRIVTATAAALAALHDFMRFQIIEHRTGDAGKIEHEAR